MEESNSPDVMAILHGTDRTAIKNLITNDSKDLRPSLCLINLAGPLIQDVVWRRTVNKTFVECLTDIKGSHPLTLVWMKKNLDHATCDKILSDHKYAGKQSHFLSESNTINSQMFLIWKSSFEGCL